MEDLESLLGAWILEPNLRELVEYGCSGKLGVNFPQSREVPHFMLNSYLLVPGLRGLWEEIETSHRETDRLLASHPTYGPACSLSARVSGLSNR